MATLDKDNKVLPPGKVGEVCIQGPNVTKGYLNRPEANEEAFAGASLARFLLIAQLLACVQASLQVFECVHHCTLVRPLSVLLKC